MGDEKRSVLIVTVSDSVSAGTREDRSGTLAAAAMEAHGWEVSRATVPDERDQISALLSEINKIFTRVSPLRYTEIGFTAWIIDVANVAAFLCRNKGMLKIYGVSVKGRCLHGRDTDS